jgi:hypothetical protein
MTGGSQVVRQMCASWAVTEKCVQDAQCTRRDNGRWRPKGCSVCKSGSHEKMRPGRTVHKERQLTGGSARCAVTQKCVLVQEESQMTGGNPEALQCSVT